jgi:hypothetical protein
MTSAFGFSINTTRPDFNPVMFAFDFGLIVRLPVRRGTRHTAHDTRFKIIK